MLEIVFESLMARSNVVVVHSVGNGCGKNQRVEKAYAMNNSNGAIRTR
jgi:hypothetical protein